MNADENALQRAIQEATAEDRAALTDHPEVDDLLAYQKRTLPEEGAATIREHLSLCPDCADFVLGLEGDEPKLTEEEHAEDLAEILAALPSARLSAGAPEAPPIPKPWRAWMPVAAGLLVGVLGLGLWLGQVPVPWQGAPAAPTLLDLYPLAPEARGVDAAAEVQARSHAERVLILNSNQRKPDGIYRLEIRQEDSILRRRDGLRPNAEGTFTLIFPARQLPVGLYEFRLYSQGAPDPVALYRVEIVEPTAEP